MGNALCKPNTPASDADIVNQSIDNDLRKEKEKYEKKYALCFTFIRPW